MKGYNIVLLFAVFTYCYCQESSICNSKGKCGDCIQEYGCIWCTSPKLNSGATIHCINATYVNANWCSQENIIQPVTNYEVIQNDPLSSDKNKIVTQIQPQHVKLKLRRGETYTIDFTYKQADNYPVDLYYIMDLSASMRVHKEKLADLGTKLSASMKNVTNDFKLGFGSFVDKKDLPYVSTVPNKLEHPCSGCVSPYSFKNHLSLSNDSIAFEREVKTAKVSGNLDAPEGGFDALMQAMVCKQEIGWREKARHLIVFSTDADFHIAGDGKLAGIVQPNDAECHMAYKVYQADLEYDYPSVSQINYVARQNNINIIFAIVKANKRIYQDYEQLQRHIENSGVGALDEKSENVINLILENYYKIADSVKMTDNSTSGVKIAYSSDCATPIPNGCSGVTVGKTVNFKASITPIECSKPNIPQIIHIKPEALNESLIVELEVFCECPCEEPGKFVENDQNCNNGDNVCGVCVCDPGRYGTKCECTDADTGTGSIEGCKKNLNDTEMCSGVGTCKCGTCDCNSGKYGKYCECSDTSCSRVGNELCSGLDHGICKCGECDCKENWGGKACECSTSEKSCMSNDNKICSGNGTCQCGTCICNYPYSGKYCEESPTGPGRCNELLNCVLCQAFNKGNYSKEECETNCTLFKTQLAETITDRENVKNCRHEEDNCKYYYQYEYDDFDKLIVTAQTEIICSQDPLVIIASLIGSIVLAGLVLLIIWKIFTVIHDKREYVKFENERKNAKWNVGGNPLFRQPVSNFQNPTYSN